MLIKQSEWPMRISHNSTALSSSRRLTRIGAFFNFADHQLEGGADILVEASAGLCPATAEFLSLLRTFCLCDLSLFGAEVGLVANYDDRNVLGTLWDKCSA